MVPDWHTYWKFPGDAGIPTEMKWNLPPGWKAGPIQWPIPLKLNEPGDIQIYGYHDEVLLMLQLTPPATIADRCQICRPKRAGSFAKRSASRAAPSCSWICPWRRKPRPPTRSFSRNSGDRFPNRCAGCEGSAFNWSRKAKELRLTIVDKSRAGELSVGRFFPAARWLDRCRPSERRNVGGRLNRLRHSDRVCGPKRAVPRWIDRFRSAS